MKERRESRIVYIYAPYLSIIYLSVCLSVCLSIYLSIYLLTYYLSNISVFFNWGPCTNDCGECWKRANLYENRGIHTSVVDEAFTMIAEVQKLLYSTLPHPTL